MAKRIAALSKEIGKQAKAAERKLDGARGNGKAAR